MRKDPSSPYKLPPSYDINDLKTDKATFLDVLFRDCINDMRTKLQEISELDMNIIFSKEILLFVHQITPKVHISLHNRQDLKQISTKELNKHYIISIDQTLRQQILNQNKDNLRKQLLKIFSRRGITELEITNMWEIISELHYILLPFFSVYLTQVLFSHKKKKKKTPEKNGQPTSQTQIPSSSQTVNVKHEDFRTWMFKIFVDLKIEKHWIKKLFPGIYDLICRKELSFCCFSRLDYQKKFKEVIFLCNAAINEPITQMMNEFRKDLKALKHQPERKHIPTSQLTFNKLRGVGNLKLMRKRALKYTRMMPAFTKNMHKQYLKYCSRASPLGVRQKDMITCKRTCFREYIFTICDALKTDMIFANKCISNLKAQKYSMKGQVDPENLGIIIRMSQKVRFSCKIHQIVLESPIKKPIKESAISKLSKEFRLLKKCQNLKLSYVCFSKLSVKLLNQAFEQIGRGVKSLCLKGVLIDPAVLSPLNRYLSNLITLQLELKCVGKSQWQLARSLHVFAYVQYLTIVFTGKLLMPEDFEDLKEQFKILKQMTGIKKIIIKMEFSILSLDEVKEFREQMGDDKIFIKNSGALKYNFKWVHRCERYQQEEDSEDEKAE